MKALLREIALLALAWVITWAVLFRPPEPVTVFAEPPLQQPLAVALTPHSEAASVEVASVSPPASAQEEPVEEEPQEEKLPPPPELGAPDGEGDTATAANQEPETPEETPESAASSETRSSEQLMEDSELLSDARAEVSGEAKRGFATVLLASPEEQLEIARFFGEELVLVPRESLNPEAESPTYFSVEAGGNERVQVVSGRAPLEGYRQYRDLFDYEYARLPDALRELRRSVLTRNEIFLFAALIPVKEWAVIVGRRREALDLSGREISDVRRFVLRYVKRSQAGFDLCVEEILFADEERFHPPRESQPKGS